LYSFVEMGDRKRQYERTNKINWLCFRLRKV
jgi:hypothetical protein